MPSSDSRVASIMQDLFVAGVTGTAFYFLFRYGLSKLDFSHAGEDTKAQEAAASAVMRRIDRREESQGGDDPSQRPRKQDLVLNRYEQIIAAEVVSPEEISVGFEDIGGLEDVIEELREAVIYPLTMPYLYSHSSSLLSAPSGVLLYGPPGCGKTMLAKALAHESGANFINLHISTLTEKWFGDSNKLVHAVFSLARKLQPTIVFIDEIDAVLGQRRSGEHEASGMVKAEFMTHWDGLASANAHGEAQRILILGATNRIQDIDEAILRRMPKKFPVSLPTAPQRLRILALVLKDTRIDRKNFDLEYIVRATHGLSGSDLKNACRDAAMVPVRECIRQMQASGTPVGALRPQDVRGVRTEDFFATVGAGPKHLIGLSSSQTTMKSTKQSSSRRPGDPKGSETEEYSDSETGPS